MWQGITCIIEKGDGTPYMHTYLTGMVEIADCVLRIANCGLRAAEGTERSAACTTLFWPNSNINFWFLGQNMYIKHNVEYQCWVFLAGCYFQLQLYGRSNLPSMLMIQLINTIKIHFLSDSGVVSHFNCTLCSFPIEIMDVKLEH